MGIDQNSLQVALALTLGKDKCIEGKQERPPELNIIDASNDWEVGCAKSLLESMFIGAPPLNEDEVVKFVDLIGERQISYVSKRFFEFTVDARDDFFSGNAAVFKQAVDCVGANSFVSVKRKGRKQVFILSDCFDGDFFIFDFGIGVYRFSVSLSCSGKIIDIGFLFGCCNSEFIVQSDEELRCKVFYLVDYINNFASVINGKIGGPGK